MRKLIVSLVMAVVLTAATVVPAMGAPVETPYTASVTVAQLISATLTDNGAGGVNFGTLDPGTTDNEEANQPGDSAVSLDIEAESNVAVKTGVKALYQDFGNDIAVTGSGTATGGDSTTVLVDSTADYVGDGVATGDYVYNITDGSWTTVTTVTDLNTLTCAALTGGTDGNFQSGDAYKVSTATTGQIDIQAADGDALWHSSDAVGSATSMLISYAQIGGDSTPGVFQGHEIYHWLSIPDGQAADTYSNYYYYKADTTL